MRRVWALYPSAKHVLPRMRVLLDFLANWFREARNEEQRATPKPPAAVTSAITPRTNGAQASSARVRLRAG